jgi:hypothetical protein
MKHPTIIASIILTAALLVSTLFICLFLHSLEESISDKSIPVAGTPSFPGVISVEVVGKVPAYIVDAKGKPQPVVPVVIQTNR